MTNFSQLHSEGAVLTEQWSERCNVATFENGGRAVSQELSPLKAGRGSKMDVPLEPPEMNASQPTI